MENKFLEVKYDKFSNTKTTSMCHMALIEEGDYTLFKIGLSHDSTPEGESLYIDLYYEGRIRFPIDRGIIININNVENIFLESENYDYHYHSGGDPEFYDGYEEDHYEIDKETLKKICDATSVDIRIHGDIDKDIHTYKFIKYAQVFYNGFYDNEAYREVLNEDLWLEVDEEDSTNDSSDSGCVVTLLLISSALSSIAACLFFVLHLF